MFSRYNSSTMSDIDPQATNDLSPDPSAENIEQSPSPATPSAETPAEEAVPADSTPENLSSGISAEVDALLADQEAASDSKAASPPAEENIGNPSVDPTAILDAALGAMNAADNLVELAPGARTTGSVQSVNLDRKEAVVEFGPKDSGICSLDQFDSFPNPGDRFIFVLGPAQDAEGLWPLRLEGSATPVKGQTLEKGQVVEALVKKANKGGLELSFKGIRCFMPASQVDVVHHESFDNFVGLKLEAKVIEVREGGKNVILSRRALLIVAQRERRKELLKNLTVGDTVEGTVQSLQPFGAFVDLGGLQGLVHVAELSHSRVNDPAQVVKVGQSIRVKVLKIEKKEGKTRVALSLKQTMEDPFVAASGSLEVGAELSGRVTKILDFGAFVEVAPGIEGLVHISEISNRRIQHPSAVLKPDMVVQVTILSIDEGKRKVSLTMRSAADREKDNQKKDADAMRVEDPSVRKLLAKFGSNRELRGGI